jgi:hypothetical protein
MGLSSSTASLSAEHKGALSAFSDDLNEAMKLHFQNVYGSKASPVTPGPLQVRSPTRLAQ